MAYLRNSLFSPKSRGVAVIFTIAIIIVSYSLFFYLQNTTESNIRDSIFEQQKARQIQSTQALSQRIGSDLDSIMARLQGLASSSYLQQADLSSYKTKKLLQEMYLQINNITTSDRLFIVNKDCIVMTSISLQGQKTFVGANVSSIDWVREANTQHKPVFSNGYFALEGNYRIAISYPIINRETGQYIGLVGSSVPATQFFEHYGNIFDIKSQYLAVLDRNSNQLIHPIKSFIGKPFFGSYTQQITGHNNALNGLVRQVMSGKSDFAVYSFENGERLNTGFPIFLNGKPTYFVFVITPTSAIYSQIDKIISTERLEMFSLIVGTTVAIVILVVFLIRWSSKLDNEVKRRTEELNEVNKSLTQSNKHLAAANEQLKVHDKMQKEFINIAAHELRTPIQPILGLSQLIRDRIILSAKKGEKEKEQNELCQLQDVVIRNAKRLHRLADDILDVSRIESQTFTLQKEKLNLNELISDIIEDCKNQLKGKRDSTSSIAAADYGQIPIDVNLTAVYKDSKHEGPIFVEADKGRMTQVIYNLLSNAFKFTKEGTISITVEKKDSQAIVSVEDTGEGINSELLPSLFSKFAAKSYQGTGLGLFISKSIVEAHGGRIWAENNSNAAKDGKEKGATFHFSLPVSNEKQQQQQQRQEATRITKSNWS
ncbi:MAG: sensor histidine kinase [Nitrososphaeraceae archaeon]|nr:sensor histidine kinase [Nitrososphaeraceae archaeon]